jgi:hypothetical protein
MADMIISRKCKDCGKTFKIAPGEQRFYQKNNLELPARCKSCRDARKSAKEAGKK